jgi:hypothetical protein
MLCKILFTEKVVQLKPAAIFHYLLKSIKMLFLPNAVMFVFSINKNKVKKQLIIAFLLIFTLIKISPYYYSHQYIPYLKNEIHSRNFKVNARSNHSNFLIRLEKSFIDKIDVLSAPKIKFTGIPFDVFFSEILFITLKGNNNRLFFKHLQNEICIVQSVFRL